jgi:hypothetical protein
MVMLRFLVQEVKRSRWNASAGKANRVTSI